MIICIVTQNTQLSFANILKAWNKNKFGIVIPVELGYDCFDFFLWNWIVTFHENITADGLQMLRIELSNIIFTFLIIVKYFNLSLWLYTQRTKSNFVLIISMDGLTCNINSEILKWNIRIWAIILLSAPTFMLDLT